VPEAAPSWLESISEVLPSLFGGVGQGLTLETKYQAAVAYGLGGDERLRDPDEGWLELAAGRFLMGAQSLDPEAPSFDPDAAPWEGPVIEAEIDQFAMRRFPVTVQEYLAFVEDGGYEEGASGLWSEQGWTWLKQAEIRVPLDWQEQTLGPNCPVTGVSWFEAEAFTRWLTETDLRDYRYRIPSEVEWEYAARRQSPRLTRFPWGDSITKGDDAEANWSGAHLRRKTPVGMFPRSNTSDGLSDMYGNVEEWCADTWVDDYARWTESGRGVVAHYEAGEYRRVARGGSCIRVSRLCRPTYRGRIPEGDRYMTVGFRVVRDRRS
jgi:formylglycine-generating enzyme required for sulfatase activity